MDQTALRDAIASHTWYHTMDLGPGVVTPGYVDLRPIVERMPWPDVRGKRCLDVATYDGFLAFEMERRGAAEVVAIDLDDYSKLDLLPRVRARQRPNPADGLSAGRGFRIASEALESRVQRRPMSVYELSPDSVGTFDVVVCGSLLLHLRDPLRALEAIRGVCAGQFLSAEAIDQWTSLLLRRQPLIRLVASQDQWSLPSLEGHRRMLTASGFRIERRTRPYVVPFGPGAARNAAKRGAKRSLRGFRRYLESRVLGGRNGIPHQGLLARPAV